MYHYTPGEFSNLVITCIAAIGLSWAGALALFLVMRRLYKRKKV